MLLRAPLHDRVSNTMKNNVVISPVDMKERAELGMRAGDTVRVWLKIEEKGKTRLQAFEGLILARKHGNEAGGTFTVRKVSSGVGVEKIFPLYSPVIDKIEIVKRSKVRRAKLYLLRGKVAREVKRILRRSTIVSKATKGSTELEAERKVAEAEEAQRVEAEEKRAAEQQEQENETAVETETNEPIQDKGGEETKKEEETQEQEGEKTSDEAVDDSSESKEEPKKTEEDK